MERRSQLRVYYGPQDSRSVALTSVSDSASTVDVPLRTLLDTLRQAEGEKRAWIEDFKDENVAISCRSLRNHRRLSEIETPRVVAPHSTFVNNGSTFVAAFFYGLLPTSYDDFMTSLSGKNHQHPNRQVSDLIDRIKESADKLHEQGSTRGDLKIISRAMRELAYAFKVFTPYRRYRKVTVFGSARTKPRASRLPDGR